MSPHLFSSAARVVKYSSDRIVRLLSARPARAAEKSQLPKWAEEKKRLMNLPLNAKRLEYACGNVYYTVKDILTWKNYVLNNKNLATKSTTLPEDHINVYLNATLADKVSIFRGDITTLELDAIVNSATSNLFGSSGVDEDVHRAAGPYLLEEHQCIGNIEVGEVKVTGGYKLPARYVFATVGPRGENPNLLRCCYRNAIRTMLDRRLKTLALPCISTGIYGYPQKPAALVAASEIRRQLENCSSEIDRIVFCLYSQTDEDIYQSILQAYFPLY